MAKKIIWSRNAQNDRKEILAYWNNRNKSTFYSIKLNTLFNEAAELISKYSKTGKIAGYNETRIKIVREYLMVYRETETSIFIITIWDGRQDPLKLKKIIK